MASIVTCLIVALGSATSAWAQRSISNDPPKELDGIRIEEKLGAAVPLDAHFTTSDGRAVALRDVLDPTKPTILTIGYYGCPMLCTFVLNAVVDGLGQLSFKPGKDFRLVSLSIDEKEGVDLAASKKKNYLASLPHKIDETAWQFLVGDATQSKQVAEAVGFHYRWDNETKQFAHAAGIFVLTPAGTVSRVLYGINYSGRDLRLALTEASAGRLGSTIDQLVLYCYHYDPQGRTYVIYAMNVMRLAGAATVIAIICFIIALARADRRRSALASRLADARQGAQA